ncbi:MAG: phospholipase D family protein [Gammaproteobacteria bacterium]|nr:MAG: phospholipase D family protein [Gammaproteobacteria bacterium]
MLLTGCSTVSFDQPKTASHAYTDTGDTPFGLHLAQWNSEHQGLSGFYPLSDGMDALGARLRLIEGAQRGIDVQYFLMKDDDAGEVFAGSLLRAADRGVRVRFLLDDVFTTVEDDILALLNQHPNIQMRLYNPISRRGIYYLNYAGDFSRTNRRMHSKSLTGDNAFAIVGGRNIADEYFQLRGDTEFLDYDVLAIGPIVAEVSQQFDDFWNSSMAVPLEQMNNKFTPQDLAEELAEIDEELAAASHSIYRKAINTQYMRELVDGTGTIYVAPAVLLHDGAVKLENPIDASQMTLINELADFIDTAEASVFIVTPYFIPTDSGVEFWRKIIDSGKSVTVVTNSLASTNHVPVHAGYARYRKDMLEMGASLYEARVNAIDADDGGSGTTPDSLTLHTKLMLIDERHLFVGSLNLDPRSIRINAEMGLLIDSPEMGREFMKDIEASLDDSAYKLELDKNGRLRWRANIDGEEVLETKEPLTSWWRRFQAQVYRILPESQL